MKAYSYDCPIDFMPMFGEGGPVSPDTWEKLEADQLIPWLAYEGFYFSKYDQEKFLNCIQNEEDRDALEEILEPVTNDYYTMKWEGVNGAEEPRILFYPIHDVHNRVGKNSRGLISPEETAPKAEKKSEVEWLFELLKRNHVSWRMKSKSNPVITIYHPNQSEMMVLYPCCPKCYTILPKNWFDSRDYYPISLLAPKVGGKTTLLCSWLVNNFEAFTQLGQMGDDYDVLYGVPGGKEAFKIQSYFYEQADVMYQTGKYPDTTELNCVPPMYLQIYNRKKNETLLVGIYDCAGEMLRQASAGHENATAFLTHMSAFIYLVEARRMYGVEMEEESQKQAGTVCRVLSLEEQGQMQEMMASREPVPASSLIKNRSRIVENPWEIYNSVLQVLKGEHVNRHQHMAYSIIKSDEIENRPEVRKIRNWDVLFRNPNAKRALDVNYILEANLVAKEIFRQLVIEGNEEEKNGRMEKLESDFSGVSWHCVCAAREPKEGEPYRYSSIRKADPLVGCLLGELEKLEWQ